MIMIAGQLDGLESKTIHMLFCPMSLRSLPPSVCLSIFIQPISALKKHKEQPWAFSITELGCNWSETVLGFIRSC